jgi:gliding motility-associated-like protein
MLQTLQNLSFVLCFLALGRLTAQTPCANPVVLQPPAILNADCDNPTAGVIFLNVEGGNDNYTFTWDPPTAVGPAPDGLSAGSYRVTITRIAEPECTLDTTLIVNNSDGPEVLVVDIQPASCQAATGAATLSPATLNYTWSNGQTGPTATNLAAGCYIATATDITGCAKVIQVCVPSGNLLQAQATVTKPAKCGLPTGAATITVTGGSGHYAYSQAGGPSLSGLASGSYTTVVTDTAGGCTTSVSFIIPPVQINGNVDIEPYNIRCPDSSYGNVVFTVVPGQNFALPYTFTLRDQNGIDVSPGALPAGLYTLQVTDADGCTLPSQTFTITAPPPYSTQLVVQGGDCETGGSIELNPSGGNGNFIVNWLDLPGFVDPINRSNLPAGYYSAKVYDSLFCLYPLNGLYVPVWCSAPNLYSLIVGAGEDGEYCLPPPTGQSFSSVTYSLLPPSNAGQSTFGTWSLNAAGCLDYNAGATPGFNVDSICIARISPVAGFSDTVCVLVSIVPQPPQLDTIYFAVQAFSSGSACATIPPAFTNPAIEIVEGAGPTGTSDAFGHYSVNPVSGCLTFYSTGPTGYNVDFIDVAVCDAALQQCKIITYIPTILSPTDCADGIELPVTTDVVATDCQVGAAVCLPVPFQQIFDYTILDNGAPYQGPYASCQPDTVWSYNIALADGGPYRLEYWSIDGDVQTGYFANIYDLVNLVNTLDPVPGWSLENNQLLLGGNPGTSYGFMRLVDVFGNSVIVQPGQTVKALATQLVFTPGIHTVVLRRLQTGCIDTTVVTVVCDDCPPFHAYTPGASNVVTLQTTDCAGGAVFCTNIDQDDVPDHVLEIDGSAVTQFELCAGNKLGFLLDTGLHTVFLQHESTGCEALIAVDVVCGTVPEDTTLAFADDTLTLKNTPVLIALYENDLMNGAYNNPAALSSATVTSVSNLGAAVFDPATGLLNFTPQTGACGTARLTYQITDTRQRTSTATVTIHIVCDRVLVFTGLSPNGDGANDSWQIAGIEQYPKNKVQVFNRWGNLVFEQAGYANEQPWDGRWDGRDLPDGTYFYRIDLGDEGEVLSGYLQILR